MRNYCMLWKEKRNEGTNETDEKEKIRELDEKKNIDTEKKKTGEMEEIKKRI